VLRRRVTSRQALELTPSFFPQVSAAIRGPNMASSLVPENLYPVFRATEMKTNFVGVLENFLFPNHALRAGARRSDNSEGRTGRRLAIGAMQAMNGFWRPDVHLHS
jgi:hypothetical protein